MSLVQNNPFNKPNPFKSAHFDRFQHPHLANKTTNDYSHLVYHETQRLQYSRATNNNWTFNDNNLSKKTDFSRKYQLNSSQISQFQMRMKASSVYAYPNNHTKGVEIRDGKLQNPFLRKNLIVDKQAVVNQIQVDLSIYRNRGNTTYQQITTKPQERNDGRISFGTVKIEESPVLRKQPNSRTSQRYMQVTTVPQVYVESPDPLTYSKTPEITEREISREKQAIPPKTLQFRRKTFFLVDPNNI